MIVMDYNVDNKGFVCHIGIAWLTECVTAIKKYNSVRNCSFLNLIRIVLHIQVVDLLGT